MARVLGSLVVGLAVLAGSVLAAEAPAPVTAWLGQDTLIVLEVPGTKALLGRAFEKRTLDAIQASEPYNQQMANPQVQQLIAFVSYFQNKHKLDLQGLLQKLLGGGLTLAVAPHDAVLLAIDTEDEKVLADLHEYVRVLAQAEAQKQGDANRVVSAEYRGVTGWRFAPNEAHAVVGKRLLISNKPELLRSVLDLRDQPGGPSLATLPAYRTAKKAAGADSLATLFVNTGVLEQVPQIQQALNRHENPLAALLIAPLQAALRDSTWLAAGIEAANNTLTLNFATDGAAAAPTAPEGFATAPTVDGGAWPNLNPPRRIAGFTFYRDLHRFYAAKDKLFPDRTSGLIFFENMMGIFFTGRDLTDEVLAETEPEIRFVVAEQQYDSKVGTPIVQLPGFAAVFRMKNPEKFAPIAEEAWQKALGLINFTRGQKAEPGLVLDRPQYGDVKYTMSSFSAAAEKDRKAIDVRFNFQPSLAMTGKYLILSSTDALARDLIDAVKKESVEKPRPLAGTHSQIELDGQRLASILRANREAMIQNNMVEKGNARAQSEAEINVLLSIVERVSRVALSAGSRANQSHLQLAVTVELP